MIHAHERLVAGIAEARNRAVFVVANNAQVDTSTVHRPGVDIRESVEDGELSGIVEASVVPDLDAGVGPPVKAVARATRIVESGFLLEDRLAWMQGQLNRPVHAIDPVDVSNPD